MKPVKRNSAPETPERLLADGLRALDIPVAPAEAELLMRYVEELSKWNSAFNLTAVRAPEAMVTRHLLDSLAVLPVVEHALREVLPSPDAVPQIIDVGSGAGLPAIPLAIVRPQWRVFALDSNGKKTRFMRHAQRVLGLRNLQVVESRCETFDVQSVLNAEASGFDVIISRAFAAAGDFLQWTRNFGGAHSQWLAMKGRPDAEELRAIPGEFELKRSVDLDVPGLVEARHILVFTAVNSSAGVDV